MLFCSVPKLTAQCIRMRYTGKYQLLVLPTPWWVWLSLNVISTDAFRQFEENSFQISFDRRKDSRASSRFGDEIPGHWSFVWESVLSILVEFEAWNSHETSICRMQRAGRVIDSEKIRQVGRNRWSFAMLVQGGNCVCSSSFDWQPVEGSEQRLWVVFFSSFFLWPSTPLLGF